ncbi:hypothetical protein ACF0H5_012280 [Mactra antiquata]
MFACRFCYKQFIHYRDYSVHERMHFEQLSTRGMFDNPAPPYTASSSAGTLDSFDKLIQPFRTASSDTTVRPTESRIFAPSSQSDFYLPSSSADPRNMVSSPVDPRTMVATSPSDHHNILPSSPADQRNTIPSSPADPRNLVPSSPAEPRNIAASSPADQRILPTSPVDPRSLVPASPVDPRAMVPASPVDPRAMVPASPVDPRNMISASPVDPRNLIPASPVDQRNMVPGSPATQHDPRNLLVSSPASQPDKTQQIYRNDLEAQSVGLLPRVTSLNPQSSMSIDNVSMSTDVHSITNRTTSQVQIPDVRHQQQLSLPPFYGRTSEHISSHPMSSSSLTSHSVGRSEEIIDNRQHTVQKPDPYYGVPKTHYHSSPGLDVNDPYHGNQYGVSKLFSPASQYYQQGIPSQGQVTPYGIDKLATSSLNYYHPANINDKSSVEQQDMNPTQTLHYGPSTQNLPVSNHSLYQTGIPHNLQMNNSHLQKVSNSLDQSRPFQSVTGSSHSTNSQLYPGPHPQTQVYTPVPSHALPSHHDYKLSVEPVSSVNLETRQDIRCSLCQAQFLTIIELQTHLKSHVPDMIAESNNIKNEQLVQHDKPVNDNVHIPGSADVRQTSTVEQTKISANNSHNNSARLPAPEATYKCECGRTFSKYAQYLDHVKTHNVSPQYECKICKKVFKKKSKCSRHEALHSRDLHLYYCEFCELNFEHKGKYLQHVQRQHSEVDVVRAYHQRELQVGTKKAVPLTGGSIDTTFDNGDQEKFIDCQICDEEICKVDLFVHLKRHDVHPCEKCDLVFLQKTECVAHLMIQHRKELDNSSTKLDDKDKCTGLAMSERKVVNEVGEEEMPSIHDKKMNKSRKEVIKDLKKKKKEVMQNLREKEQEIQKLKKQKVEAVKKTNARLQNNDHKTVELNKVTGPPVSEMKLKFGCSKCEQSFAKKSDLTAHVQIHVKDPNRFNCEVCDYSYHMKEKGYYIYHMKYHRDHELSKPNVPSHLPCIICNTNISKDTFVTHVKRAHSQYSCDICQWSYSSENTLVKHMRTIHVGKKYKNYVYDKSHYIENIVEPAPTQEQPVVYKKLKDIKAEQKTGEGTPKVVFPCQECNRTFTKKQYYERHLKTHSSVNEDGQIACEICKQPFESRGTYIYHIQHHDVNQIENDDKQFVKSLKKNQLGTDSNVNNFDKLDSKINDSGDLKKVPVVKQTLITVLNPVTGDFEEQLVEESDEPEIVFDIKLFEDPLPSYDDDTINSEDDTKVNVNDMVSDIVYCKLCNKSLKRNDLPEHTKSHQTFNCDFCQYSFTKKARYLDHCRILHLSDFIEKEIVHFEQTEKSQIEDGSNNSEQKEKDVHRRKKSTKVVNCPLCTTECKLDKFVEHVRTHSKPEFLCKFCDRTFSKKTYLQVHEKSHEFISFAKTELPYPKCCPYCEIPLKSRENYLTHLVEHSRKTKVKCKVCDVVFASEKNLDNHTKTMHDPNIKVYWSHDGEGMKFDSKNGRIFEVSSDYISEIKEINELFKQFGLPSIWMSSTPKKLKSSSASTRNKINDKSSSESSESIESSESEEKMNLETSDEDYIPERTLRQRKSKKSSSESDDVDDDDDDDDDYVTEEESDESKHVSKRRSHRGTAESDQTEKYTRKSTRTRSLVKKSEIKVRHTVTKLKSIPGRVLRSTLEGKSLKVKEKGEILKRKFEVENKSSSESPKKRRSEVENLNFEEVVKVRDNQDFPEKCPVCGIAQFSLSSYETHSKIHNDEVTKNKADSLICPVCKQTFTRECNKLIHIKHRHKGFKLKTLKKRDNKKLNVKSVMKRPSRTTGRRQIGKNDTKTTQEISTPLKGSKLVVRLSPIDVAERIRTVKEKGGNTKKQENKLLQATEKKNLYTCEICKKTFNQRWNFVQHVQSHKRDSKKKEKDTKLNMNKKDVKKKDKESKPFSCKDCSESFKKKRDLYIHTKIHFSEPAEEDENGMNSSTCDSNVLTESCMNESSVVENSTDGINDSYTDLNETSITASENDVSIIVEDSEKADVYIRSNTTEIVEKKLETRLIDSEINASPKVGQNIELNSESNCESLAKDVKTNSVDSPKDVNVAQNNNEDHIKVVDNEDEKSKLQRAPSVNKLSAVTAVTKWKARVTELLTSQIELNATKKQEEVDKPQVQKVKDYLSTRGKNQKLKYECRICGDIIDQEDVFKSHMNVHINESPPHCNKCDIYFMAIYPKRRLIEHNRKKHPELNS